MKERVVITEGQGNLLDADVDALINTVNTVGVMGKGIALQFKRAFPDMFKEYSRAAKRGEVELGRMHVWQTGLMTGPRFVINFPTKGHWRSGSRMKDIEVGLDDLVRVVRELDIDSLAVPPLGCGHGGLDWAQVEPVIRRHLAELDDVDIHLFAPAGAPAAAEMTSSGPTPSMSRGTAILVETIARYTPVAMGGPSLIETQKLLYFVERAGEDLRLEFAPHLYGPYSDRLRHLLTGIEGHYVTGFGDGSAAVQHAEPLVLMRGARDAAQQLLAELPETAARIDRVLALAEGFESAYGMELLSTVHWVTAHSTNRDDDALVAEVRAWSPRKGRMFTPDHIRVALTTLRERGWAPDHVGV